MWWLPCCLPRSRWSVLVCCMYLELCGGSVYITNLYLASLRPIFFSSSDAETRMEYLVFACNLGNWLPLAGFIYDSRFGGPRNVVYIGAALTAVGYGGLYLCSAFRLGASFWQLCLLWFLWGHGSGYFDCVAITVGTSNFRESRGMVVGLTKSFYGLSGSLLAQPFNTLFSTPESAPSFLLFLAVALSTLAASVAPLVHLIASPPPAADAARRRFTLGYSFVASLAVALVSASLLRAFTPLGHSHPFSLGMLGFVIASLLALPLFAWGPSAAPAAPAHRAHSSPAAIDPAATPLVACGLPDNAGDGSADAAGYTAGSLEDGCGDADGSGSGDGDDGDSRRGGGGGATLRLLSRCDDSTLGSDAHSPPSPTGAEAAGSPSRRDSRASGGAAGVAERVRRGGTTQDLASQDLSSVSSALQGTPRLDSKSVGETPATDTPAAMPPSVAHASEAFLTVSPANAPPLLPAAAAPKIGGSAAPPGVLVQLRNPDLWLLFCASFAGFGGGIVLLNHVQKVVAAALDGPGGDTALAEETSSILVSILSAFNCLGRMAAGVGSDCLRGLVPRPVLLSAAVATMGAAHLSLTQARTPALLYACCCVAGTAYGCVWSLLPAIVGDLFPPSRFASFYNLFSLSASSSSLLLSTLLATRVYAAHAQTVGPAHHAVAECFGPECYRDTHLSVVAVCVGGAACALAVAGRNRQVYRRIGAAR